MAITADFTADVISGERDLTVTFTDTSTGSPTNWLWNFGDGSTSKLQNPSHTYTTSGSFTVKLRAFTSTGETLSNGSRSVQVQRQGISSSNVGAHTALLAASFAPVGFMVGRYVVRNLSGTFTYTQGKSTLGLDLTTFTSHVIEFRIPFTTVTSPQNGVRFLEPGIVLPSSGPPFFTDLFVEDVTEFAGTSISRTLEVSDGGEATPTILTSPGSSSIHGWDLASNARIYRHTFAAGNNDLETKAGFITVTDPLAKFSGTPRKGLDSIDTVFSNETAGTITAFSWKRRPSGISAPYVEFSTLEDPTETFDVTIPTP